MPNYFRTSFFGAFANWRRKKDNSSVLQAQIASEQANAATMDNALTRTNPPSLYDSVTLGYSQITTVEPGRLAFISGQVAWRANGEPVPESLAAQAEIVMDNARKALKAIGASSQDIVMARIFMIDVTPERQELVLEYMRRLFNGALPCVTGLGVVALGGPDLQLELELVVRAPS